MDKKQQLTIDRYNGCEQIEIERWKDLISSLVLCGYEVYGDNDRLMFTLGYDDKVKEINNNV